MGHRSRQAQAILVGPTRGAPVGFAVKQIDRPRTDDPNNALLD